MVGEDYKENHERAVYILGEINQDIVERITPGINKLRLTSNGAITLYIDSPGGDVIAADNIRNLVKCPSPDGHSCKIVTVVTGMAASAAADLLALGDYAIAHGHTRILYHGSRRQDRQPLTYETARSLAYSLQETNEMFARRLAQRIFIRFTLKIGQLHQEFKDFRNGTATQAPIFRKLEEKISSWNRQLISKALTKQEAINQLTKGVFESIGKYKRNLTPSEFEGVMLTSIIKQKVKIHANDKWLLSRNGLQEVSDDFRLIDDYFYGAQNHDLRQHTSMIGALFLSDQKLIEFNAGKASRTENENAVFLGNEARPKMRPIWYFLVSLCRILQTDDYLLTPEDAYWLGLVDEVPGSGLPNLRESVENAS